MVPTGPLSVDYDGECQQFEQWDDDGGRVFNPHMEGIVKSKL